VFANHVHSKGLNSKEIERERLIGRRSVDAVRPVAECVEINRELKSIKKEAKTK
jgi:hypothetical protein